MSKLTVGMRLDLDLVGRSVVALSPTCPCLTPELSGKIKYVEVGDRGTVLYVQNSGGQLQRLDLNEYSVVELDPEKE